MQPEGFSAMRWLEITIRKSWQCPSIGVKCPLKWLEI
jgi:hypothetical protein